MKRNGIYLAAAVLFIVNGIALANAYYNRSGEPDATVELTERELTLGRSDKENSGLSMRINWRHVGEDGETWFDWKKLETVGFDCTKPVDAADAELHYSKALPRKAYAVLELSGSAWETWTARQKNKLEAMAAGVTSGKVSQKEHDEARKRFTSEQVAGSRLVAIDVGSDPEILRKAYPDRSRYIITPALVRLRFWKNNGSDVSGANSYRHISGYIESVLTDTLHVPKEKASILPALQVSGATYRYESYAGHLQHEGKPPRFAVTVNFGKRHEPWVVTVRKLDAK